MTDFRVAKEDVGRIAIDENWCEWKLVHWEDGSGFPATWRSVGGAWVQTTNDFGAYGDFRRLVKWKPREKTIWVNVTKYGSSVVTLDYDSKEYAETRIYGSSIKVLKRAVPISYEDE